MDSLSGSARFLRGSLSNVGAATAPDSEIMRYAVNEGFILFTHDLDFGRLLAFQQGSGPGVVQIRPQDVLPTAIGALVVSALNAARTHLVNGALVTIDANHDPVRLLPI